MTTRSQKKLPFSRQKLSTDQSSINQSLLQHVKSDQNLHSKQETGANLQYMKLEQQYLKEIQLQKRSLQKFSQQLQTKMFFPKNPPNNIEQCIKMMYDLERLISIKDGEVQQLSQEIKYIKINPPQQEYINQNNRNRHSHINQIQRYRDEIHEYRKKMHEEQISHQILKNELAAKQKQMQKVLEIYSNKSIPSSRRIINYSEFVLRRGEKKPEDSNTKGRSIQKNQLISLRQVNRDRERQKDDLRKKKSGQYQEKGKKPGVQSNNLKDVENKKNIAETALRGLKKKHQAELNQLLSKLDFLKDENDAYEIKLNTKIEELRLAEEKFSYAKMKQQVQNQLQQMPTHSIQNRKVQKAGRYSQPQL